MRTILAAMPINHKLSSIFSLSILLLCFSPWFCSARDNITLKHPLTDLNNETLVSTGGRYELGFFTPTGRSDSKRYIGIWHKGSSPQTVVWVANRDQPLSGNSGVFSIAGYGNLMLQDAHKKVYWKALRHNYSFQNTAKLMDSGNLVILSGKDEKYLWQSFDNPTDTFLCGMNMSNSIVLTSWRSNNDSSPGDYSFQQEEERQSQYKIMKNISILYWQSSGSSDFISSDDTWLPEFFSCEPDFEARLVMNSTGEIQFYGWSNTMSRWSLRWFEPNNKCSVYNACGNFGSCNSNTRSLCKCLPGFEPKSAEDWKSREFSEGCIRKSDNCSKNVRNNEFLKLTMMRVSKPGDPLKFNNETECRNVCLNDCHCRAYSCNTVSNRATTNGIKCWLWSSEDLKHLRENFTGGRDLYVRVAPSDIELTKKDCETCGTNIIPYPLSTGKYCGDPMYFSFDCSTDTGQLSFKTLSAKYTVTNINQELHTFTIQIQDAHNCTASDSVGKLLQLDQSMPFNVSKGCNEEVDIGWKKPLEPPCKTNQDCKYWLNTTCNTTGDDKQKRCRCNAFFQWDGFSLNCTSENHTSQTVGESTTRKKAFSLVLMVTIASVVVLSCTIVIIYIWRRKVTKRREKRENVQRNAALHLHDTERRVKDFIDSGQFKEEDKKDIDVPFFDLESILAATDNFSDANKLGKGGFGPVYKGNFPGGQEIAVKRLSSVSGQGLEEFKNEVVLIARLQHRNLVRLLGYCIQGDEKILLYEYMPNKSLDTFIFDESLKVLLDWEMRFNIILGIARGLLYLHQDSRLRIIHRDLKTSNILLDGEMNPKISDFGLARIFEGKQTEGATNRVVGTYGYMSPEYALDGFFSVKSDVFSFGVVVLEIVSGKRNTGFYKSEQALSLLGHAWRLWREDKALDLMDQTLRESCKVNEFFRCINVGLLCVQEDPNDRPTMSNVIIMLGSETGTVPTPKRPAFVVRRALSSTASSSSKPLTNTELPSALE